MSASFATLGDVLIAEPGAHIGFAGPSVIEQTIRQKLPDGFQTAEFLLEHGMLDLVEPRENLRGTIRNLLDAPRAGRGGARRGDAAARAAARDRGRGAGHRRRRAAERATRGTSSSSRATSTRPHTLDYIGFVFDDFSELHGDRLFGEDAAIVGGLARLGELHGDGHRPPEGPHDRRADGAQLRHARARRATARRCG